MRDIWMVLCPTAVQHERAPRCYQYKRDSPVDLPGDRPVPGREDRLPTPLSGHMPSAAFLDRARSGRLTYSQTHHNINNSTHDCYVVCTGCIMAKFTSTVHQWASLLRLVASPVHWSQPACSRCQMLPKGLGHTLSSSLHLVRTSPTCLHLERVPLQIPRWPPPAMILKRKLTSMTSVVHLMTVKKNVSWPSLSHLLHIP